MCWRKVAEAVGDAVVGSAEGKAGNVARDRVRPLT
jgi:hypothetical protein